MKLRTPLLLTGSFIATTIFNVALASGGTIPQMDFSTWPKQIFWLVVIFGGLYISLHKVALPQVSETIAHRENRIAERLADAKKLFKESQQSQDEQNVRLAQARDEANKIRFQAREDVQAIYTKEISKLEKSLDTQLAKAEASIAEQSSKALAELESSAADATGHVYTQLTGKPAANDAIKNIVTELMGSK